MAFLNKKRKSILFSILGIIALVVILILFRRSNGFHLIKDTFQALLSFELNLVTSIYNELGLPLILKGNIVYITSYNFMAFDIQYLLKKWTLFLLLLIWVTPTSIKRKAIISLIFIPVYILIITIKFLLIIYLCNLGLALEDARSFGLAIAIFMYLLILIIWIDKNPRLITKLSEWLKNERTYIYRKYKILVVFLFLLLFIEILLGIFEFRPWITFLFTCSHKILKAFHYDSMVDTFYLLGKWGNIYMAKGCLGIRTMLMFTMSIYLLGEKLKPKLIFISIGILIINIANILRFVFLFIFIQNHDVSQMKYDVHDVFNFVVYTIVIILLIIWLEWFSDIWPYVRKKAIKK
jgi:exosortase/archaeosortase family protein